MSEQPRQGDIWWAVAADKRRPVLVVTRSEAVPVLDWLVVAPVTQEDPVFEIATAVGTVATPAVRATMICP